MILNQPKLNCLVEAEDIIDGYFTEATNEIELQSLCGKYHYQEPCPEQGLLPFIENTKTFVIRRA